MTALFIWSKLLVFPQLVISIIFIILLKYLPESPKWQIILTNENIKAKKTLQNLRQDKNLAKEEYKSIIDEKRNSRHVKSLNIYELINDNGLKWQVISLMFINVCQPMVGIQSVTYYGYKVFKNAGLNNQQLQINRLFLCFLSLVMTYLTSKVIEKWGRKILLIVGLFISSFWMLILLSQIGEHLDSEHIEDIHSKHNLILIISLIGYVQGFAIGPGPIPWIYNTELVPTDAKSATNSLCSSLNWLFNFLIGLAFPHVYTWLKYKIFIIFIVACLCCAMFTQRYIPETKNKNSVRIFNDFSWKNRVNGKKQYEEDEINFMEAQHLRLRWRFLVISWDLAGL